ncbi:glycosylase [Paenibacillus sp. IHBB 3054]|uniref:glycosylase n=1 Tax=Paenibacillus sp. IHBB 3054 TaxID=3425689 RepID=UPI003F670C8C
MLNWKKKGLIFNPCEDQNRPSWRWNYAQGQNVLILDSFVRVYFSCREKPNEQGQTISRIAYVDLDRENLTKVIKVSEHPVVELGGIGEFDEFGTYPFSVVRHGDKIYGYYGGVTRCESVPFNVAIGCAISENDGESFKKIGRGPVVSYSIEEPFVVCSPKVRIYDGKWYLFYSTGRKWVSVDNGRPEIYYKLRMATSKDGIHWDKLNKDIIANKLGEDEAQACGDVIYKNGVYHMFFCYRKCLDFRNNVNNSYRIGYAVSRDLIHWTRKDEECGINVSKVEREWDSEMIAYPNVFELDGKIYMLYLGNEVGKYGFGLAELEGDLI